MSELRACPFCGNDATLAGYPGVSTWVLCLACHAEGPVAEHDAEAIAAWNRRTPATELREALNQAEATFKKEERDWRREQPAFRNGARHAFSHVRRSLLTDSGETDG